MSRQIVTQDGNIFRFQCPHCNISIITKCIETKCCIYRCGILKSNGEQIPPHTNKIECDKLFREGKIYGCSRPFRFVYNQINNYVESCGYI